MRRNGNRDYDVGYGKPPVHSQFKKGQSGNPTGRRKGMKVDLVASLERALAQEVTIVEQGRRMSVEKQDAFTTQILNKALSGSTAHGKMVIRLWNLRRAENASEAEEEQPRRIVQFFLPKNGREEGS